MNIQSIDLNLLVAFEAIYSERSISKAAVKIGLSQPALSAALGRLRIIYDDPIFVRTPRGMKPTERARRLWSTVSKALALIRSSLTGEPAFVPENCRRIFRVSMSDWLSLKILPVLMGRLQRLAPPAGVVVLNLAQKAMYQALQEGRIDIGISGQPNLGSATYRQFLYHEHYECLVWSRHSAIKDKLTLKDYVGFPHILFSPQGSGPGAVDQVLAKKGLKRRIALRVVYSLAIPQILRGTDLIATVPAPLAHVFANAFDLKALKPPIPLSGADMIQYWSKECHAEPAHQWFRGLLAGIGHEFQQGTPTRTRP